MCKRLISVELHFLSDICLFIAGRNDHELIIVSKTLESICMVLLLVILERMFRSNIIPVVIFYQQYLFKS